MNKRLFKICVCSDLWVCGLRQGWVIISLIDVACSDCPGGLLFVSVCVCVMSPTSLPYIMRWWVVIRALKTTTQLELAVRSNSVSASWGMFTFISLVQWIRSGQDTKKTNKMREEERLTQENRTKSSDEKLLKITLTDTMPNYFSHREREKKKMQTHSKDQQTQSTNFIWILKWKKSEGQVLPTELFLVFFWLLLCCTFTLFSALSLDILAEVHVSFIHPTWRKTEPSSVWLSKYNKKNKLANLRNNLKIGLLQYIVLHHCFNFPPKSGIRFL